MRLPVFPVLGTLLFVAVFGPFALMVAGPALTGDPDAAQVGLYLLLSVNPIAIPSLLFLLGVAWAIRSWTTLPVSRPPEVTPAPRPQPQPRPQPRAPRRTSRSAMAPSARRTTGDRDVVIDVVAVRAPVRAGSCDGPRLPAPATARPAICFQPGDRRA
ncbi:hypothetical protein [Variovorax sp. PvP013]|uniref:hypothetical protein n=1 Tax=Variovorax sp. PvP013 TaxID=3156435 RepID=UPI003D21FDEC